MNNCKFFDFHTHKINTPPGEGIVCLPQEAILFLEEWKPQANGFYAAGIHPWWTAHENFDLALHLQGVEHLLEFPEVVQLGECGFDRLQGASIGFQTEVFERQIALSEKYEKPVTIHCVRAFDVLLAEKKRLQPKQQWTIHGFRGKPMLAQQLLDAGFNISFGINRNEESWNITPSNRRHEESDGQ